MLGVFDLRTKKLYAMSDNFEEDLTSVCLMKNDKKVLTSTSEGIINIFSWDYFGDCNDRIVGHPGAIDTMVKYDEDIVITGCEDGQIRAVSVLPNEIVAVLGLPTKRGVLQKRSREVAVKLLFCQSPKVTETTISYRHVNLILQICHSRTPQ